MGLRDIFRGKSDDETEDVTQQPSTEADSQGAVAEQADHQPSEPLTDSEPTDEDSASAVLTTKQNLTKAVHEYNVTRADLQDLLFSDRQAIQDVIDLLEPRVTSTQSQIDDANHQIKQIQTELEQAGENASAPFVKQQTELNGKIEENQGQVNTLTARVNDLNQELENLNQKQQQLIQAETDISAKFESEKDPAVIVTLADQYRDDIENNKDEREKNAAAIAVVDEKQQNLKQQLDAVQSKLTADQDKLQEINHQLEEVQLKVASENEGRSQQLAGLKQDLTKNQAKLDQLQNHLDEKNRELAAANQEIADWLGVSVPVKQLKLGEDSEIIVDMDGLDDEQFVQLKSAIKVLTDRGAGRIGLYTSQFKLNLTSQIAKWTTELQVKGGVVSVYNPLYSLQHQGELGAKYQLPDDAVTDEWNDDNTERTLVLDNGWTLKARYFDQSDAVSTVDSYKGDHLAGSSTLTREGQLTANRFYNDDGTKNRDEYYSQSGLGILNVRYEQDELSQVELLNAVGMQVQSFESIDGFTNWWLKNQFNRSGLLLGTLNNEHYRELLRVTHGEPIALVTGSDMKRDEFTDWMKTLSKQQYLADNYATEMKLIQELNQPLTISLMDPRNLPVSLGVPVGDGE